MFTEGLDETAINWVKQGSGVDQQARSPLAEKLTLGPVPDPPSLYSSNSYLSPNVLPPLKFYSGLLGSHPSVNVDLEDDESIASAPDGINVSYSDTFEEEDFGSSDSDLFEKPSNQNCDEEVKSCVNLSRDAVSGSGSMCRRPTLVRGLSKENLKVEVPINARRFTGGKLGIRECVDGISVPDSLLHIQDQNGILNSQDHLINDAVTPQLQDIGTPSAPPMVENVGEEIMFNVESKDWMPINGDPRTCFVTEAKKTNIEVHTSNETKVFVGSNEALLDLGIQSRNSEEPCARSISEETEMQMPRWQTNSVDQMACYNISSGQSAWQTFVAYDACFRLCLNAWARDCMEAPEFLRDECIILRNAFGLQKYLLQPRGQIPREGRPLLDSSEDTCTVKEKKVVGKVKVEVRKVRIIARRKLRSTFSQRAVYMQVGAEYVRHVSALLKTRINSIKVTSFSVAPEEVLSCLFQLRSSTEDAQKEPRSAVYLQPGTGDSYVFYPESQGDALLVEVQDLNKVTQGHATIHVSSLTDNPSDRVQWWPIYHDDHECVGKVQLSISFSSTSGRISSMKSGPVVETVVYDLVLEAAMRAQHFHSQNLHINGAWKWLLNEFADYYGVSDVYTKLRYLSYILSVATPKTDCLELLHELLLPVVKARGENNLTRQEKSLLLECEAQVETLLATAFENYKSLDELSPTGLAEFFGPTSEVAAPALCPAVQIYTLLHDILSQEGQSILKNYLQTAATKRCRRHMVETDEFMSSNSDGFVTDPVTISTAYLKIKSLCLSVRAEIEADIKIHNQHILPSSIDLPNISTPIYSTKLCKRLREFLAACPPSKPSPLVTELLITTADFERDIQSWNISPVHGGLVSRDLFHDYIMVWVQGARLHLLELCKAEKVPWSGVLTRYSTSPFIENMYDQIKGSLNEYEVVINRWPQYLLNLEVAISDVERAVMKTLEKQYTDTLTPLRDSIPKILEKHVQKFTRRQSASIYCAPDQLGTFLNTVKRMLDVLHGKVEHIMRSWESALTVLGDGKSVFGEQMNGITVMLRKKYKNYVQAIVEKLVSNTQANRSTRLKKILEETKDAEGEPEIRDRMQPLCLQLTNSICNLHNVFSSRIFVTICRGFWDKMGQIVLRFLESQKENRNWYRAADYALGILDDLFASQMQTLQGNSLQEKDLDPPRSVIEARSILC